VQRCASQKKHCAVAIIPLGRNSRCGSSSLPEGCYPCRQSPCGNCKRERSSVRFRARHLNEPGWLSPPIWPCTTRGFPCLRCYHRSGGLLPHLFTLAKQCVGAGLAPSSGVDVSQVSLLPVTALHSTGGLFSVALSVAQPHRAGLNPAPAPKRETLLTQSLRGWLPDVIRRVALFRHQLSRAYDDGVRTFLPLESCTAALRRPYVARASDHPAHPLTRIISHWANRAARPCSPQSSL
jgi:hypothetical protein